MKRLLNSLNRHISDETLSRLISGELSHFRSYGIKSHLDVCWQCRSRREALERAAMQLTEYRSRLTLSIPPDARRRQELLQALHAKSVSATRSVALRRSVLRMRGWIEHQMTPLLTSAAIVCIAGVLLFFVWHRDRQTITPAQFLARATAAEDLPAERSGVIYQRVSIRNGSTRLKRDLYRDAKGIRHRRIEPVSVEVHPIQQAFSGAGIDWDDPLSARSYRTWHDQQHRVSDEVKKDDDRHLTLVTTLESGPVSQESLTVRLPDFHPIQRTIETRDNGTIEIAELSYAVLDWSAVNQALFEPLHGVEPTLPIHIRAPLSDEQLDVAELAARLSLNHLHADDGEQINVVRGNQGVLVKGIVESDERKRALIAQLHLIPHVNTNILSIPELESAPLHSSSSSSITAESLSARVSPLQAFLSEKGQQEALGSSSTKLLDAALAIHRNAVLIDDLRSRFGSSSAQADTAYKSLLANYTDRLNSAINTQLAVLNRLGFVPPASPVPRTQPGSLEPSAEHLESFCRELISGDAAKQRTAPEIAADLYQALFDIRSSTQSAQLPK